MAANFAQFLTVQFQQKLMPAADRIYAKLWPNCRIERLTRDDGTPHILDAEFAIDTRIHLPSGQFMTMQEKYRENHYLKRFGDFTVEYRNAAGTEHESDGEYFKLGSQLYFYGWSNASVSDFEKWFILNVVQYKILVEKSGGITAIGTLQHNYDHGRASFYGLEIKEIEKAIIYSSFLDAAQPPPLPTLLDMMMGNGNGNGNGRVKA